jgi:hypothetical protein
VAASAIAFGVSFLVVTDCELAHEGLAFHWNALAHGFPNPNGGQSFFNTGFAGLDSALPWNKVCPYPKGSECFYCSKLGPIMTCKASRISVAALEAARGKIPASCDQQTWSAAIVMAYGTSNKDLFQSNKSAFLPGADTQGTSAVGVPSTWPTTGSPPASPPALPNFPFWQSSPLVLDLAGDGIETTSVARGVRFDLAGAGPLTTAWLSGRDDALLALDRNGNGRIDDGSELFGNVAGGRPRADGFQALAELDARSLGGNEDGVIDRHDRMFSALRLWRDANRDGVAQPRELRALARAGVAAIGLAAKLNPLAVDPNGNDLRLEGHFLRASGQRPPRQDRGRGLPDLPLASPLAAVTRGTRTASERAAARRRGV